MENGNESTTVADDAKRRRLMRLLYVGLALVFGGLIWRVASLVNAFSAVSRKASLSEKSVALSEAIGSAPYPNYVVAIGALLAVGCGARLIVLAFRRKEPR